MYLQAYEKPSKIPEPSELQYTLVLTKQSALFNAWKEMNRVSNEYDIPFRCVSQWATYTTGKLHDTIGIKLPETSLDESLARASYAQCVELNESKSASVRKRVVRGKKSGAK